MKIAVLGGAGGMGAVFGARLAQAGHQVTLLDVAQEAVDIINSKGLVVELKSGEKQVHKVPATTRPESVGVVDLVLNFVKCYHTEAAIRSVLPILGDHTAVLTLQNGWGNAPVIASLIGAERVLVGVTYHSASVIGPGHVLHAAANNTFIGPLTGAPARAKAIVEAFLAAGLETVLAENVLKEIWGKLSLNICTLPTSALLRFGAAELGEHEGTLQLMRGILREGLAVARGQGVVLDEEERWTTITGVLKKAGAAKSSMYQDVEKFRRTEIDVINGAIVAGGKALGIATPLNDSMVWLIKSLEETFGGK